MKRNAGLRICTFTRSLPLEGRLDHRLDHRLTWVMWGAEMESTPEVLR